MPQETPIAKRKAAWEVEHELDLFPSDGPVHEPAMIVKNGLCDLKKAKIETGMKARAWTLRPVLADEYLRDVEAVPVYVATITDRQRTCQLVKTLSAALPMGSLQHLKRVRTSGSGMSNTFHNKFAQGSLPCRARDHNLPMPRRL